MIHDIITLPIAIVALESAPFFGKQILDNKHMLISHKNLKMAICLKNLYNAKDRHQNNLKENKSSFSGDKN